MARPWDRPFPLPCSRLSLPGSTRASARDAAERPLRLECRSTRAHLPEAAIDHREGTWLNEGPSLNPDDNAVVARARLTLDEAWPRPLRRKPLAGLHNRPRKTLRSPPPHPRQIQARQAASASETPPDGYGRQARTCVAARRPSHEGRAGDSSCLRGSRRIRVRRRRR